MKQFFYLLCLLILVGCQTAVSDLPTPLPPANIPATPTAVPTAPPTATTQPQSMDTPTTSPTVIVPTETAVSPTPTTLLGIPWDDRTIFQTGLIESEQPVLEQLPGATVYQMMLQIEEGLNVITARQEVYYTNQENVPLQQIYFHLYPNLLGGNITVSNVHVNGQPVNPIFESVNESEMQLPLTQPLQPGERAVVQMEFSTTVPQESGRNYGVFALLDDILALAHFYPIVAVYDEDGWNVEEPALQGDITYNDMSFYLVQITAPKDTVVVASGVEVQRTETAESQTITLAGGPMRDYYIASSSRYVVVSDTTGQTRINSYAPAEYQEAAIQALDYAKTSIEIFNNRLTPYPYTEFDIVSTSTDALGIEYPGIVAITLREYDPEALLGSGIPYNSLMEGTVAHEAGHQWFYNLVGNDQLDEPWLDESLTQYITWIYYVDRYGRSGAQDYYNRLESRWERVDFEEIPIGLPVSAYDGAEYSGIIYGRGPIFVNTLAETVGQNNFDAFLRNYFTQFKWGIITTPQFEETIEQQCQCDLDSLFAQWVYSQ